MKRFKIKFEITGLSHRNDVVFELEESPVGNPLDNNAVDSDSIQNNELHHRQSME